MFRLKKNRPSNKKSKKSNIENQTQQPKTETITIQHSIIYSNDDDAKSSSDDEDDDDHSVNTIHTVDTIVTHRTATEFLAPTAAYNMPTRAFRGPSFIATKHLNPSQYARDIQEEKKIQAMRYHYSARRTRNTMQSHAFWSQLETNYETDADEMLVPMKKSQKERLGYDYRDELRGNCRKNSRKKKITRKTVINVAKNKPSHNTESGKKNCLSDGSKKADKNSVSPSCIDGFDTFQSSCHNDRESKRNDDWALNALERGCDALSLTICGTINDDDEWSENSLTLTEIPFPSTRTLKDQSVSSRRVRKPVS